MGTKAKKIVEKDILDRLNKIAFHFEERKSISFLFEQFSAADLVFKTAKTEKVSRLKTRIQSEELSLLIELVHLRDNAQKLFEINHLNLKELKTIDGSAQYKVAANFVNIHKHGSRGRNKPSAKIEYFAPYYIQEGEKPSPSDKLLDIHAIINFEGKLFNVVTLIEELILIWIEFFSENTTLDLSNFKSRIHAGIAVRNGQSTYSADIPEAIFDDAKKKADDRKHTNI